MINALISTLHLDPSNPRRPDQARMALLRLSLQKLGFVLPLFARSSTGMLLSGHQRIMVAQSLQFSRVPVERLDIPDKDVQGVNILCNRATNDFTAFDTGHSTNQRMSYTSVVQAAEQLDDFVGENWYALRARQRPIRGLGATEAARYDKKAIEVAKSLARVNVRIPIVISESGRIINGIHRLFAAKEDGLEQWPIVELPDVLAEVASMFLNYLSMDYAVGAEFSDMLRYSAYRRPQNNRGVVPKAYRFWANGCRTLPDKDSYTVAYWNKFRDMHGPNIIDFGAGLGKVAPFLRSKGMNCIDFEPYRIDTNVSGEPSPALSKQKALEFLNLISNGEKYNSIFMASVLNSIPFAADRLIVLAIVHALSDKDTVVYGTCRDISDFSYEYGGIRNANYFVFDSEPGVRVGDVMYRPKIQKFHTVDEAKAMLSRFWVKQEFWPGGNIFYFKASHPKTVSHAALARAIEHEFNLPYADGTRMGLVDAAKSAFGRRLGVRIP